MGTKKAKGGRPPVALRRDIDPLTFHDIPYSPDRLVCRREERLYSSCVLRRDGEEQAARSLWIVEHVLPGSPGGVRERYLAGGIASVARRATSDQAARGRPA